MPTIINGRGGYQCRFEQSTIAYWGKYAVKNLALNEKFIKSI